MSLNYQLQPATALLGDIRVPGDKSMSHRSIMLGSIANGVTCVRGFLQGEDSLATLNAFRRLGVTIELAGAGEVIIHGVGREGLRGAQGELNLGNSGTSMRLMAGLLAGQSFDSTLIGDASLTKRPMRRVTEPLTHMGAVIDSSCSGTPPLQIRGGVALRGIDYRLPVASAQVKSALLLAGLYAEGTTRVSEPAPTRDHTERMLRGFGYEVLTEGASMSLKGGGELSGCDIDVPADISSATFFMVGALIAAEGEVTLRHVGINPTRIGVINILRQMGATIELFNQREVGGEPVADLRLTQSRLHGIAIPEDQVPLAIDEFPALFIAAAAAEGETVLTGAAELRVKESDRIAVMAAGLTTLGVTHRVTEDGIVIQGQSAWGGGTIHSQGDHRIAMAFAMASLRAKAAITITDCANVATSFPGFVNLATECGLPLQELFA
ncbi:3-phosphoshikimate 1-carboxyvinyltransferase [Ectothiorhodospiraceae bacterium BW-2]|nr:3-phosphoshikimate 1-carboxyvinyltransferase [Ectothiorhodospiraceae bacterium BW-2]